MPLPGPQTLAYISEADELFFGGRAGAGKMLYINSMIPTPSGFRVLADLRPGDLILGRDGKPYAILGESPDTLAGGYRFTFDDGSEIISNDDHKWLTFTAQELSLLSVTEEKRAKRRESRPSRSLLGVAGGQGKDFTPEHRQHLSQSITERNKQNRRAKPTPEGGIRTTAEIVATLRTARGRTNHAIPVCDPVELPHKSLPLDPYVLGVWLGDGSSASGDITSMDDEVRNQVIAAGFPVKRTDKKSNNRASTTSHVGLRAALRSMGLLKNKHVPHDYLWASKEQRLALLQGLMDTDGGCEPNGGVSFTNTNKGLTEAVAHLARSLGHKAAVREGVAKLNGRVIGPKWSVSFSAKMPVFRLTRKIERIRYASRRTTRFRYVVKAERVEPMVMKCLCVASSDHLYLAGEHFIPTHNSDVILGLGLTRHRKSLILRREATQLQEISSRLRDLLWPNDRFRSSGYGGICTTSDGRTIELAGCEHETDKQKYKGRAHDLKAWDEVVDFPESVYTFVNGWNRTTIRGQRCRVVAASNPPTTAEGEWVIRRWRAWLDPHCPNRAAPGELRWYTTIGDKEEEFAGPAPVVFDGETYYPRSRTFIPGDMIDLLKATGYQNTLATLPEPLRSIYLKGDFGAAKQDDRWQLIPSAWVELSQKRWAKRKPPYTPLEALGVDVAMEGKDSTCIAPRYGLTIGPLVKRKGRDTPDGASVCDLIIKAGGGKEGVATNVDAIGIGKSAYDTAVLLGLKGVNPIVVSEGTNWKDPKVPAIKFGNLRAAMMWKVRALLDPEGGDDDTRLALPPDAELAADLCAPHYRMAVSGLYVESKDDIRKRIGRSTDAGDSVGLACWERAPVSFSVVTL